MVNHATFTDDYLYNTRNVLDAGRLLRNRIGADLGARESAIVRLESAAQQQSVGATAYRSFMFSTLEATAEEELGVRERVVEDNLATILADLQVSNVLMAAGLTLGETEETANPALLDEALLRLEETTTTVERSLVAPLEAELMPGRFNFSGTAEAPAAVTSPDLPTAITQLRTRADSALTQLVQTAQEAVSSVVTALSELDEEKILKALEMLGTKIEELPKIGRLLQQGIAKLESAIDALIELLGSDILAQAKEKVEQLWKDIQEGKFISDALNWAFDVSAARERVEELLQREGLDRAALDGASNELEGLTTSFADTMGMVETAIAGVTLAGAVLALTPLVGPQLALVTASAYVALFAIVVLIGMDYADTSNLIKRVRGVRVIVSEACS